MADTRSPLVGHPFHSLLSQHTLQARKDHCRALARLVLRYAEEDDVDALTGSLRSFAQQMCEARYLPGLVASTYDLDARRLARRAHGRSQSAPASASDAGQPGGNGSTEGDRDFSLHLQADRQRCILAALRELPAHGANDHTLRHLLGNLGHVLSLERLREELHEMAREGAIEIQAELPSTVIVQLPGLAHPAEAPAVPTRGAGTSSGSEAGKAGADDEKVGRLDAIMLVLSACKARSADEGTLLDLLSQLGHQCSREQLHEDLHQLGERGAVWLNEVREGVIASLAAVPSPAPAV